MSTEAPAAPAAGKSKKPLLLVLVVVGGVVLGGGAGAFMAGPLLAGGAAKGAATAPAAERDTAEQHEEETSSSEGEHGGQGAAGGAVVHLVENLVLNPANTGGSRFLLLSVGFGVKDEATAKVMQDRDPELRDLIIRYFGARTVEQLVDVAQRDSLKAQLKTAVGERFGKRAVHDVYFPQFVIQ